MTRSGGKPEASSPTPRVSVVMSVFNGASHLESSIESVLNQTFRDFEFIVVDDGSQDGTFDVLQRYEAADSRIRVLRQENAGLTRALSLACRNARGEFVARQDVGDRSLATRLGVQVQFLDDHPEVVAVGAGARRVGPQNELLGERTRNLTPRRITEELWNHGYGLLHPASMFRRVAYEKIGGYRQQFRFAQDTDLWYRMSEVGLLAECSEILFEQRIELNGISGSHISRQIRLAELARSSWKSRRAGKSEAEFLRHAQEVSREAPAVVTHERRRRADAAHFIGCQLLALRDPRCRNYFLEAMILRPRLASTLVKYCTSFITCHSRANSD